MYKIKHFVFTFFIFLGCSMPMAVNASTLLDDREHSINESFENSARHSIAVRYPIKEAVFLNEDRTPFDLYGLVACPPIKLYDHEFSGSEEDQALESQHLMRAFQFFVNSKIEESTTEFENAVSVNGSLTGYIYLAAFSDNQRIRSHYLSIIHSAIMSRIIPYAYAKSHMDFLTSKGYKISL